MKQVSVLAVLLTVLLSSISEAAILTQGFRGVLNGTTSDFLNLTPDPSGATPRDMHLVINFNDDGTLTGRVDLDGLTVDTFAAGSGWAVFESGANDVLNVAAQSATNLAKFLQFSMSGGNVTAVATNDLSALSALLAKPSLPTSILYGNNGSGLQGYSGSITSVPEPATMGLLALGTILGGWRMSRRRTA